MIVLLVYPILLLAFAALGYYWRLRSGRGFKSFATATLLGGIAGLTASVMMALISSYDYFLRELLAVGIPVKQIVFGAIPGACVSAGGWKSRGEVERRQKQT